MPSRIKVTVRPTGDKPRTVSVNPNTQVRDILDKAGVDIGRDTILVANGVKLKPYDVMGKHREIIVIPTVKGGK